MKAVSKLLTTASFAFLAAMMPMAAASAQNAPAVRDTTSQAVVAPSPISTTPALPPVVGSEGIALSDSSARSPKVPESVNLAVKRLGAGTADVTLDDINEAREAIAKLEVLIDIEKKVSELNKIRKEREGSAISPVAASALLPKQVISSPLGAGMPPVVNPTVQTASGDAPTPIVRNHNSSSSSGGGLVIERIYGVPGNYLAQVKNGSDASKTVKVGDKLSDGSRIQSISSAGVLVTKDGKTHLLAIKDAGTIYSVAARD